MSIVDNRSQFSTSRRSLYRVESLYSDAALTDKRKGPPPGLINACVLGAFYGYFALNMDNDSDVCYANDESDQRLGDDMKVDTDKHYTNVGQIYHFCF